MKSNKLTEEELSILFEYAEWYDSMVDSPANLIKEFESQRFQNTTKIQKEQSQHKSISLRE